MFKWFHGPAVPTFQREALIPDPHRAEADAWVLEARTRGDVVTGLPQSQPRAAHALPGRVARGRRS
jgi:hypothetical protein